MATSAMTSYGIIVPASRHYFIVNAQPGHEDYVQKRVVLNPSPTQLAKIQESGDIFSVMSDGGPSYTTRSMEFTTNNGSIVNARFVDGSQVVVDDQQPMRIAKFILSVESCPVDDGKEREEEQQQEEQDDDDDDETEEVEEDIDYESEEEEEEDMDYESEEEEEDIDYESEEEDMDYESEEEVEVEKEGGEGDGEGEGEGEMCVICQEEYEGGEMIGALECGHEYHPKCIKKWLAKNRVCPICRFTDFSS